MSNTQTEAFTACLLVGALEKQINEVADLFVAFSLSQEFDGINLSWKPLGSQITHIVDSPAGVVFRLLCAIKFYNLHHTNKLDRKYPSL